MKLNKDRKTHFKVDAHGHTCVVYIRKNACSALKGMILDNIGDDGEGKTDIRKMADYRLCNYEGATTATVRSFIIRDPLQRVISGWLNQVVQKVDRIYHEMFDGMTQAVGKNIQDITFNDFLNSYLTQPEINGHFKSVIMHLYPIKYTHVLHDQSLYEDARIAFGDTLAQNFFLRPRNSTQLIKSEHVENASDIPAGEIFDNFKNKSALPTKESFLNGRNIEKIQDIYSDDVSIYHSYLEHRKENSGPVPIDFSE